MKTLRAILILLFITSFFFACSVTTEEEHKGEADLVIYCENGILGPIKEISDHYKNTEGIKIKIRNDCARNLVSLLHYRREADIFIPDARYTIDNILLTDSMFFSESRYLGHQALVFFVPEGNPDKFNGHLNDLVLSKTGMALANPESSTLGLATGLMLKDNHLYEQAMHSVLFLTIDSRNLFRSIAHNEASLAIGWKSDYTGQNQAFGVDTINIQGTKREMTHHEAYAMILRDAANQKEALRFLELLTSGFATHVFEKYEIVKDSISGI